MRRFVITSLLALAPALMAAAPPEDKPTGDKPKADKPAKQEDDFQAVMKEIMEAGTKAREAIQEAKTDQEKQKIVSDYQNKIKSYSGRFLAFAEKNPKDKNAVQALQAAVAVNPKGPDAAKAVDLIIKDHAKDPQVVRLAQGMGQAGLPVADKLIRGLLKENKDPKAQVQLTFALGTSVKGQSESPDLKFADAQKLQKEAEDLLEKVAGNKEESLKPLADQAKAALEDLRKFGIGQVAPNIAGEDLDGKKFELKDYRGKVVVLDFWASWCGPCMALVPHEKKLTKRLEGKPFALLGIDVDAKKDAATDAVKTNDMSWRNWYDGQGGPIGKEWKINAIPAIYVLDAKGVIRYKGVRNEAMDKAVNALLKEMDAKKKAG